MEDPCAAAAVSQPLDALMQPLAFCQQHDGLVMCIESALTLTSLSLCRLCCEPPGDPGQPARPVQAPGLPAGNAGVGLPQTDHQGHRPGAQGQQLHPGQFSLLVISAATQIENMNISAVGPGAGICCREFTYRPHASVFTLDISARSASRPCSQREPTTGLPVSSPQQESRRLQTISSSSDGCAQLTLELSLLALQPLLLLTTITNPPQADAFTRISPSQNLHIHL